MPAAKGLLLVLWLSPASYCYCQQPPPSPRLPNAPRKICWQENRRLSWTDFQAKSFPKSAPFKAQRMAAVSATWSTFYPVRITTDSPTYQVDAVFLCDSSWINRQELRTPAARAATLLHEQLHFDIAELIARKLRQRIARGTRAGEDIYSIQTQQDLLRIQEEESVLSDQLDKDEQQAVGHDAEALVRQRWQLRIARELALLATYKSTPATCPY